MSPKYFLRWVLSIAAIASLYPISFNLTEAFGLQALEPQVAASARVIAPFVVEETKCTGVEHMCAFNTRTTFVWLPGILIPLREEHFEVPCPY